MNEHIMGMNYVWWMGIVEDRNDPLNIGRCRVRIFHWNNDNKQMLPTEQLLWAHPIVPLGSRTIAPPPEGTMVKGFFMDGDAAQHPIMEGIVPGIPDTTPDTSKGFSDPRTDEQLQNSPRPPDKVEYKTDGSGVDITEAPAAKRYPIILNEPTTSRLARHENIDQTIVAQKNANRVTNVGVATGGVTIDAGIDVQAVLDARALLGAILPKSVKNFLNQYGNISICGVSINSLIPSGVLIGDINFQTPQFVGGEILLGGLALLDVLQNGITLSGFANLAVDIDGCIIGPGPIGGFIHLDSGLRIPTLPNIAQIAPIPGLTLTGVVHGGVHLGTMGGIPLSTSANWSEPLSPYNARYPYNHVHESESGHVIEIDDTPGSERLHRYHRSGTFEEIGPDGSRVTKVVKNDYQIVMSDNNVHVMGDCNVTVSGKQNEMANGDKNMNVDGSQTSLVKGDSTETILGTHTNTIAKTRTTTITENENKIVYGVESHAVSKDYNVVILGDRNVIVKGKSTVAVQGDCQLMVAGNCDASVGGNMTTEVLGDSTSTVTGFQSFTAKGFFFTTPDDGNFIFNSQKGNFAFSSPLGTFATNSLHTGMNPTPNH